MDDSICSNSSTVAAQAIAAVNIVLGVLNILLGLLVVIFVFLFKRHHFHGRRLVIYLSICVILFGIKAAIDVHAFIEPIQDSGAFCMFCGFLVKYALTAETIVIFVITVDTFLLVACYVNTNRLEILEVFVVFVLPISWLWVPLYSGDYGSNGALCDIKLTLVNFTTCQKNSSQSGFNFALYMFWVPFFLLVAIMVVLYVVIIPYLHRSVHSYEGKYNPQTKAVKRAKIQRAKYLLVYPVLYIAFTIVDIVNEFVHYYNPKEDFIWLTVLAVLASNGRGIALLLAYTFEDKGTRSQLRCSNIVAACITCCCCTADPVQEYDGASYVEFGDSLDGAEEEKRRIDYLENHSDH